MRAEGQPDPFTSVNILRVLLCMQGVQQQAPCGCLQPSYSLNGGLDMLVSVLGAWEQAAA